MSRTICEASGIFVTVEEILEKLLAGRNFREIEELFNAAKDKWSQLGDRKDEGEETKNRVFRLADADNLESCIRIIEKNFIDISIDLQDPIDELAAEILDFFFYLIEFPARRKIDELGWPFPVIVERLWIWDHNADLLSEGKIEKNKLYAVLREDYLFRIKLSKRGKKIQQLLGRDLSFETQTTEIF